MVEAHGDGSWLYLSGKIREAEVGDWVMVDLGNPPRVFDIDFRQVEISGDFGLVTNLNAKGLKKVNTFVRGTSGNDRVILTKEHDTFTGYGGRDVAKGRAGDDFLSGREGNDRLVGGSGNDTLSGGDNKDLLKGGGGNDELYGGDSDDKLIGGSGDDRLVGGPGFNKLSGDEGDDLLDGTFGRDLALYEGLRSDYEITVVGGNYRITDLREGSPDGTDTFAYIEELKFADGRITMAPLVSELSAVVNGDTLTVSGPAVQNDPDYLVGIQLSSPSAEGQAWVVDNSIIPLVVEVVNNSDQIATVDATGVTGSGVGVSGALTAYLSPQGDVFSGNGASNEAHGGEGNDTLYGGDGSDRLYGDAGDDLIFGDTPGLPGYGGGANSDQLYGGAGNDTIVSGNGYDTIDGGDGDDLLGGGHNSNDTIDGGAGEDIAVYFYTRESYTITFEDEFIFVEGPYETDILTNVEILRFGDGDVSVSSLQSDAHPADAFAAGRSDGPLASSMLPQPIEIHMPTEIAGPELLIA
ncbi:MAG: calcium-binding protein [Parasphingopyxis sp.]